MAQSNFQLSVEKKFDYMCRLVLINEKKNYYKQLKKISDKESTFTDTGDYVISQFATVDSYSIDSYIFTILGIPVEVENEFLVTAIKHLSINQRKIILLYYFLDLTDLEIANILNLKRSTVNRQRNKSLSLIKEYLEEKNNED